MPESLSFRLFLLHLSSRAGRRAAAVRTLIAFMAALAIVVVSAPLHASARNDENPVSSAAAAGSAHADAGADKLVFTNGDTLTGTLVRADRTAVVFKSAMLNEVTVPWKNVRTLTTSHPYTVMLKDRRTRSGNLEADVETIRVAPKAEEAQKGSAAAAAATPAGAADAGIPLNQTVMVLDAQTYEKRVAIHPELWQGWKMSVKGGVNLIEATQSQQVYTGAFSLVRATPELEWLPAHDKTTLSFLENYGKLTQEGVPTVRTGIFHALAEQDEYLTARFFGYISAVYDHNIAQSLSLQQAYGGGVGWKIVEREKTQIEAKSDLHYTRQSFEDPETENDLMASSFSVTGMHKLPRALLWRAATSFSPAYNRTNAFQMSGSSSLSVPLYHSLSLDMSVVDNYLNNPQPGFLRNSLQVTSGFEFNLK
jgi:hypothetical protein